MTEQKKRRGRPKKEDNQKVEEKPNKSRFQSSREDYEQDDIPEDMDDEQDNDDDLKRFLKEKQERKNAEKKLASNDIDEETLREIEEFEKEDGLNDIPNENFNPLEESVIGRSYTGGVVNEGNNNNNNNNNFQNFQNNERIIEEPNYQSSKASTPNVDSNLINNSTGNNDIPNNNSNGGNSGGGNSDNSNDKDNQKASPEDIRKTADIYLLAYKNFGGVPFTYFSEYDIKKLESLDKKGEIDITTEVDRKGTTFKEYAENFNKEVEKAFKPTDEEVESLREPLVDVLSEQNHNLTATQRLLLALGQIVVAKGMLTVKFMRQKKADTADMKQMHAEKMEELRRQTEIIKNQTNQYSNVSQSNINTPKTEPNNLRVVKEEKVSEEQEEEKLNENQSSNSNNEQDAEIIEETNEIINMTPTLEDALNLDEEYDDGDNDIPNA